MLSVDFCSTTRQEFLVSYYEMAASEPKWVNSILNITGVNSLRLEDLHLIINKTYFSMQANAMYGLVNLK